ncbi:hypothetical protein GC163_13255 [bacterium]|nr:hypothetical protein [bacterium]
MSVSVDIRGLNRVLKQLRNLEPKLSKKVLRKALREGAKVVQKEAKSTIPKVSGTTRKSLKVRAGKRSKHTIRFKMVTAFPKSDADAFYYSFVELGTQYIRRRNYLKEATDRKRHEVLRQVEQSIRAGLQSL